MELPCGFQEGEAAKDLRESRRRSPELRLGRKGRDATRVLGAHEILEL